jgi:hypothetical protein
MNWAVKTQFGVTERPLLVRPDIQPGRVSALRSEPDIRLKWVERSAYDPEQTVAIGR